MKMLRWWLFSKHWIFFAKIWQWTTRRCAATWRIYWSLYFQIWYCMDLKIEISKLMTFLDLTSIPIRFFYDNTKSWLQVPLPLPIHRPTPNSSPFSHPHPSSPLYLPLPSHLHLLPFPALLLYIHRQHALLRQLQVCVSMSMSMFMTPPAGLPPPH